MIKIKRMAAMAVIVAALGGAAGMMVGAWLAPVCAHAGVMG